MFTLSTTQTDTAEVVKVLRMVAENLERDPHHYSTAHHRDSVVEHVAFTNPACADEQCGCADSRDNTR